MTDAPLWDLYAPDTSALDRILDMDAKLWIASRRITWAHYQAMLGAGIPSRDLAPLNWGIVRLGGREIIVTDDARLRGYLSGPILAPLPL